VGSKLAALLDSVGPEAPLEQIRRDALVNLAAIKTLEPYLKGSYVILLRDGGKLLSSRSFAARLKELLARSR